MLNMARTGTNTAYRVLLVFVSLLDLRLTFGQADEPPRTGYCEFPNHLWQSWKTGSEQVWVTRTEYDEDDSEWWRREEIKVNPTHISVEVVIREPCDNVDALCEERRQLESAICLSEEPGSKYRVKIDRNKKSFFTCLKFERRKPNIIQVFAAKEHEINEDKLCHDEFMERIPWPWIAREQNDWSFCPLSGGFDFKAKLKGTKKVCSHQWRPSRMENECILGEGLQFTFPDKKCSIFSDKRTANTLYCWGSWTEGEYTFLVLGELNQPAHYTLRLNSGWYSSLEPETTAYFYYSPVCPTRGKGRPPKGVLYAELNIRRSESGVCYDESEKCAEIAREGKCTSAALHKFANYCKKSCGICGHAADMAPSVISECVFPREWRGDWLWYETSQAQHVNVDRGQVSFSHLGTFRCKGKHWIKSQFKMLSYYNNGCRPRYSCMQFRREGSLLKFQLSKSEMEDRSFDLCHFEDDPYPLADSIRSSSMKILLPKDQTMFNSCGLFGNLEGAVSFPSGQSCDGSVSDWDNSQCKAQGLLSISIYPCTHFNWKDYDCLSHTTVSSNYSVILTKPADEDNTHIQCWAVTTVYNSQLQTAIWQRAKLLDTGQCGDEDHDNHMTLESGAKLIFSTETEWLRRKCYGSRSADGAADDSRQEPNSRQQASQTSASSKTGSPSSQSSPKHAAPSSSDDLQTLARSGSPATGAAALLTTLTTGLLLQQITSC